MRSCIVIGLLIVAVGLLSGCATPTPTGMFYTGLKLPVSATEASGKKEGTAECTSILSLFATGDCSIDAAKKNGGITKVSAIDWEAKNILGIYGEYKVHVYGQ